MILYEYLLDNWLVKIDNISEYRLKNMIWNYFWKLLFKCVCISNKYNDLHMYWPMTITKLWNDNQHEDHTTNILNNIHYNHI